MLELFVPAAVGAATALLATWLGARAARAAQDDHWRLEQERAAAEMALAAWSMIHIALAAERSDDGEMGPSSTGSGPRVDFTEWSAALERLALVGSPDVVRAASDLDSQLWRLHRRVRMVGGELAHVEWPEVTRPVHEMRLRLVNAVRGSGGLRPVTQVWGRPASDDEIWSDDYWRDEWARLDKLRRERA